MEQHKIVRRRLLRNLRKVVRRCGDLIMQGELWMRNRPGVAAFDLEDLRLRRAGAIRAIDCILHGRKIDRAAERMLNLLEPEKDVFKFLCNECQEPMLYVDKFLVCPNGHGKLIPIEPEFRRGPEFRKRRIVQHDWRQFVMPADPPPETRLCSCGERIEAEASKCRLCTSSPEVRSGEARRDPE